MIALVALSLVCTPLAAQARFARVFGTHMVLQRDVPLPVFGFAAPGEKVTVTFAGKSLDAAADARGRWMVEFPPQPQSSNGRTLTLQAASAKVTLEDVLVGDVWLCGGQSNMEWGLGGCDAPKDIEASNLPGIRHFGVEYEFAQAPADDVRGEWRVTKPETSPGFTAVGFYFARKVHVETGVPIGLLRSCVGGTNIELWISEKTLLETPALSPFATLMRDSLALHQKELAEALPGIAAWAKDAEAAKAAGRPIPLAPRMPPYPFGEQAFRPRCVTLHNGMIAPLAPFAVRGTLWYQGENNAGSAEDADLYIEKTRALVEEWRRLFRAPKMPFYFVQLAAFEKANDRADHAGGWAYLRDAQRRTLDVVSGTGMASAIDIGDADDIHPRNKFDVGERLARWALRNEYGKAMEVSGPLYRSMAIEGASIRLTFDHAESGLMIGEKSSRTPTVKAPAAKLARFAIAGADRRWFWADARIDGKTVVVSSPSVAAPLAVRYAFAMNPAGANLYNADGLPASPFRTDRW